MAIVHYTAKVRESRLLELPEEAQELALKPGDEITITVERNGVGERPAFPPNEGMLAALREIAVHQKDRPYTDGSSSLKLLREARAGAMYGYDPTDTE